MLVAFKVAAELDIGNNLNDDDYSLDYPDYSSDDECLEVFFPVVFSFLHGSNNNQAKDYGTKVDHMERVNKA